MLRIISALSICLTLLTTSGTAMSAEQKTFNWSASEGAPKHYPMQIINGDLHFHGSHAGAGTYVPSGGVLYNGWGLLNSIHVSGEALKPLPDKLDITFFSYLEDQFYRGAFELPYDNILKAFQEVEAQPKRKAMDGSELPNDYKIIVGVAPGGTVAVWMRSPLGTKELFYGKAEKVEMDFTKAIGFPSVKRKEFLEKSIAFAVPPDILAAIRKNGIPFNKWADYRKTYHWQPSFTGNSPPNKISVGFYNGEGRSYTIPLGGDFTATGKQVPQDVKFTYVVSGRSKGYYYEITFNEDEMFAAFNRLAAKQLPMQLEIDPRHPINETKIRLHNGKESIELKKFLVK